jgi:hypothetical protein
MTDKKEPHDLANRAAQQRRFEATTGTTSTGGSEPSVTVDEYPSGETFDYRFPSKLSKLQKRMLVAALSLRDSKGYSFHGGWALVMLGFKRFVYAESDKRRENARKANWRTIRRLRDRGLLGGDGKLTDDGLKAARALSKHPDYRNLYFEKLEEWSNRHSVPSQDLIRQRSPEMLKRTTNYARVTNLTTVTEDSQTVTESEVNTDSSTVTTDLTGGGAK